MSRFIVLLCFATRAWVEGLVLTSPRGGYATVAVGEVCVFEVVDVTGAAAPVVRVGGEAAKALRSARPLDDNATAWTFRLFLELGAHVVEACAGRCVSMIARVVRPAGHRSLQSFYHGRGDCAFTESERVVLLLDDVAACGTLAHHRLRVVVEPPTDAIERRAIDHSLLTSLACAAATELFVAARDPVAAPPWLVAPPAVDGRGRRRTGTFPSFAWGALGEPTYVLYVGSGSAANRTDAAPALDAVLAALPPRACLSLVWPRGAPTSDDARTHENLVGLRDRVARCARAMTPLPPFVCGQRARVAGFVRLDLAFVDATKATPKARARDVVVRLLEHAGAFGVHVEKLDANNSLARADLAWTLENLAGAPSYEALTPADPKNGSIRETASLFVFHGADAQAVATAFAAIEGWAGPNCGATSCPRERAWADYAAAVSATYSVQVKLVDSDVAFRDCANGGLVAHEDPAATPHFFGQGVLQRQPPCDGPVWSACAAERVHDAVPLRKAVRRLDEAGAVQALAGLARAGLALARSRVAHRDLHAGNVLVAEGRVVVVDFSWAARLDDRQAWARDPGVAATPGVGEHALHAHAIAAESDAAALARLVELAAPRADARAQDIASVLVAALDAHALSSVALAGAEDALTAARDALMDPTVVVSRPALPETHHACPPTPEPATGAHVFVLWGVAERAWPLLVQRIAAEAEILHVARLAAAASCARILRLYGHQPLSYSILEGKCGFVRGRAPALVVVARFDAVPLLPVEDAKTVDAINRAADAQAVALKVALRADFLDLGITVPDYVHGTVDACEARRDALLLTGVRLVDLVAARGARPRTDSLLGGEIHVSERPCAAGEPQCGWRDLSEAIATAAATTRLAVYRNPGQCLADDGACGDLDLLVDNVDAALLALGVEGAGTDAASAYPAAGAMSTPWSEHHFGVHLASGALALVEVRAVDDPAGFGDGVGEAWRRDMLARRECAPWGEGGACVVSERDQFYALLHGALTNGARIQARYADALESMASRIDGDAAAAVTNGTVAALAAHLTAFLKSYDYLDSTGSDALGRLAREADYPLPTYGKNAYVILYNQVIIYNRPGENNLQVGESSVAYFHRPRKRANLEPSHWSGGSSAGLSIGPSSPSASRSDSARKCAHRNLRKSKSLKTPDSLKSVTCVVGPTACLLRGRQGPCRG